MTEFELPFGNDGISKELGKLYKPENIEFITELTDKEIYSIAVILFLADYVELPEFKSFITNYMKLKVSKNRAGRKEFFDGLKPMKELENAEKIAQNFGIR